MDQAFAGVRGDARKAFETAALELAYALIEASAKNQKLNIWIHVFEKWADEKA